MCENPDKTLLELIIHSAETSVQHPLFDEQSWLPPNIIESRATKK